MEELDTIQRLRAELQAAKRQAKRQAELLRLIRDSGMSGNLWRELIDKTLDAPQLQEDQPCA